MRIDKITKPRPQLQTSYTEAFRDSIRMSGLESWRCRRWRRHRCYRAAGSRSPDAGAGAVDRIRSRRVCAEPVPAHRHSCNVLRSWKYGVPEPARSSRSATGHASKHAKSSYNVAMGRTWLGGREAFRTWPKGGRSMQGLHELGRRAGYIDTCEDTLLRKQCRISAWAIGASQRRAFDASGRYN